MSNHLYTRPGGIWNPLEAVLSAELADLDAKTVDSISGTGGTYALTSQLTIGSADPFARVQLDLPLRVDGLAQFTTDVLFFGNVTLGDTPGDTITVLGNLDVDGAMTSFNDFVQFEGDVRFDNPVSFFDNVDYFDTATFNALATFNGLTYFQALATFVDAAEFQDTATFDGAVTIGAPVSFSSGGYVKSRVLVMPDANVSYGPGDYDEIIVTGGLSANRTFTIVDAADDAKLTFSIQTGAFDVTIHGPGGGSLGVALSTSSGLGLYKWVELHRIGGTWTLGRNLLA